MTAYLFDEKCIIEVASQAFNDVEYDDDTGLYDRASWEIEKRLALELAIEAGEDTDYIPTWCYSLAEKLREEYVDLEAWVEESNNANDYIRDKENSRVSGWATT